MVIRVPPPAGRARAGAQVREPSFGACELVVRQALAVVLDDRLEVIRRGAEHDHDP
jgi:hypothetical protein